MSDDRLRRRQLTQGIQHILRDLKPEKLFRRHDDVTVFLPASSRLAEQRVATNFSGEPCVEGHPVPLSRLGLVACLHHLLFVLPAKAFHRANSFPNCVCLALKRHIGVLGLLCHLGLRHHVRIASLERSQSSLKGKYVG